MPEWSRPGDGDAEVSPVIFGEALLRMLSLPGGPGGLLILEDLHWADPETLAIVEYLADNIASTNALCLITLRDSEPSPCLDLMHSVTARRAAARIDVGRLSRKAVAQMAAACLGTPDVPRAVGRLLADCDGLPFAVEEILAAAVASGELVRGQAGWEVDDNVVTGVPASIIGSVRNRLAALGPEARNVIVSAAVLGRQFDWVLLPGVAEATPRAVLDALHHAHEVQLIEPVSADGGTFRFRHSLTRDAIVSDLLPPDLASRSSALPRPQSRRAHPGLPGTCWCELVAELRGGGNGTACSGAARLLLTAGRRAISQGALTSAIEGLRDARKLLAECRGDGADDMLDIEIDEALAEAFALSGDYEQRGVLADDLLTRLAAAGADPRRQALIRIRAASTRPEDNLDGGRRAPAVGRQRSIASQVARCRAGQPDRQCRRAVLAGHRRAASEAEELAQQSLAAAEAARLTRLTECRLGGRGSAGVAGRPGAARAHA